MGEHLKLSDIKNGASNGAPDINLILKELSNVENIATTTKTVSVQSKNITEKQEDTRSEIAKVFVYGFFILLILSVAIVPVFNALMYRVSGNKDLFIDLYQLITLLGSTVGTSLGFVTGYYFKSVTSERTKTESN